MDRIASDVFSQYACSMPGPVGEKKGPDEEKFSGTTKVIILAYLITPSIAGGPSLYQKGTARITPTLVKIRRRHKIMRLRIRRYFSLFSLKTLSLQGIP